MRFRLAKVAVAGATAVVTVAGLTAAVPAGSAGASTLSWSTSGWTSHLTSAEVGKLSAHANQRVIVLLRDQHTGLAGVADLGLRAHAFATDRSPIVAQLRQLHANRIVGFSSVNAVATTVSAAEAAYLRHDPAVLAVDPDVTVKGPTSD